jgi:anti-sigma factor RsiW
MMESTSPNPLSDEDQLREELVAYLDGELDADQSRRIEQRASEEPEARRILQEFDRTWHLLDEFGGQATSEDFTRTTLTMVAQAASEDAERGKAEAPRRRRRRALWIAAGLISAAAAGFLLTARLAPDPNAQLLEDLPILENYDRYSKIESVDFLRALNKEHLFTEGSDDSR